MQFEHILFLTGRLAERNLHRVLESMQPAAFTCTGGGGLQVAGLMTSDMIRRRLTDVMGANRVIVPGRCRGDLDEVSAALHVPVVRGPDELKDLPRFFGHNCAPLDLSRHDIRIFAEIVDAPALGVDAILERARAYTAAGAEVIDLGCLPKTAFPTWRMVSALRAAGYKVSADSMDTGELLRGGRAGADFLEPEEGTLWVADEVASMPVLIPSKSGNLRSLLRAIEEMEKKGRPFLADPILDPIHFGFTESIVRYRELRRKRPDVQIMMGIGNVTELTDADTLGMQALLSGIMSELRITNLLTTQVSEHCAGVVQEADAARRVMYAAHEAGSLPRDFGEALLALRSRDPFPYSRDEIAATAEQIKDPSFRIQLSPEGIHVYNRDGLRSSGDLRVVAATWARRDASHAFYMGVELARAEIAWQLGKRYTQDQPLDRGCAVVRRSQASSALCAPSIQEHKAQAGS